MQTWTVKKQDMGNNETLSVGINLLDGIYTAMTFSQSKSFKTFVAARKWLSARGYSVSDAADAS